MHYKQLGTTTINVSECCLGTMYFGTKVTPSNARTVLDEFLERGGNFIDTANNYAYWVGGNGEESENLIGRWMQQSGNRKKIVLATKVGAMPSNRNDPKARLEGLKAKTIIRGCEDSLRRLQTDYIDLFYIHADLKEYPLEERWEALYQLERAGIIRSKGSSNYELERLITSEAVGTKISGSGSAALQQKMSYLHPETIKKGSNLRFVNNDIITFLEEHQISLLTFSVLLSGGYERSFEDLPEAYYSEANRKKFEYVKSEAKVQNVTPSQWVLKWVTEQSDQIIPIIGASSLKQLDLNMKVFQ